MVGEATFILVGVPGRGSRLVAGELPNVFSRLSVKLNHGNCSWLLMGRVKAMQERRTNAMKCVELLHR